MPTDRTNNSVPDDDQMSITSVDDDGYVSETPEFAAERLQLLQRLAYMETYSPDIYHGPDFGGVTNEHNERYSAIAYETARLYRLCHRVVDYTLYEEHNIEVEEYSVLYHEVWNLNHEHANGVGVTNAKVWKLRSVRTYLQEGDVNAACDELRGWIKCGRSAANGIKAASITLAEMAGCAGEIPIWEAEFKEKLTEYTIDPTVYDTECVLEHIAKMSACFNSPTCSKFYWELPVPQQGTKNAATYVKNARMELQYLLPRNGSLLSKANILSERFMAMGHGIEHITGAMQSLLQLLTTQKILHVAMAMHPRIGVGSRFHGVHEDVVRIIVGFVVE